eukprot:TRINITY_DN70000_c0_g1_i1.p1 TRINITY_DN70000_c0_g1~~TRINITY_DN70000_c0_g1_i1.p1  ORF type:complete len:313 (-),score=41.21 TRINITY_DN70000_c0_g1_i1:42-980(-)
MHDPRGALPITDEESQSAISPQTTHTSMRDFKMMSMKSVHSTSSEITIAPALSSDSFSLANEKSRMPSNSSVSDNESTRKQSHQSSRKQSHQSQSRRSSRDKTGSRHRKNSTTFIAHRSKMQKGRFPINGMPQVTQDHIQQAFKEMDYERTGFLGVSELRYLLTMSGERPTDEELDEMVRLLDKEGAGKVSFVDFLNLFHTKSAVLGQMLTMRPAAPVDTLVSAVVSRKTSTAQIDAERFFQRSDGRPTSREIQAQERAKLLPAPKEKAGHTRARPEGGRDPLPLSPRQAKADRLAREKRAEVIRADAIPGR